MFKKGREYVSMSSFEGRRHLTRSLYAEVTGRYGTNLLRRNARKALVGSTLAIRWPGQVEGSIQSSPFLVEAAGIYPWGTEGLYAVAWGIDGLSSEPLLVGGIHDRLALEKEGIDPRDRWSVQKLLGEHPGRFGDSRDYVAFRARYEKGVRPKVSVLAGNKSHTAAASIALPLPIELLTKSQIEENAGHAVKKLHTVVGIVSAEGRLATSQ